MVSNLLTCDAVRLLLQLQFELAEVGGRAKLAPVTLPIKPKLANMSNSGVLWRFLPLFLLMHRHDFVFAVYLDCSTKS